LGKGRGRGEEGRGRKGERGSEERKGGVPFFRPPDLATLLGTVHYISCNT